MALLDADGGLALPIMDYTSEPPPDIVADYRAGMPSFAESLCVLLPMAITHALQIYWQSRAHPAEFARATQLIPFIQYVGYRLCGRAVTEVTSMSCQTHLVDMAGGGFSSLLKAEGWASRFPAMVPAWEVIGTLKPEFRGGGLRGRATVLAGVHDSSASYARYLAAGLGDFTLVSSGTWSIAYDTTARAAGLSETRDTAINADIFGRRNLALFGGKVRDLPREPRRAFRRPSRRSPTCCPRLFRCPLAARQGRCRARRSEVRWPAASERRERASLATLYCADGGGAARRSAAATTSWSTVRCRNGAMLAVLASSGQQGCQASRLLGTAARRLPGAGQNEELPQIPVR
jgi:hypothetical protein